MQTTKTVQKVKKKTARRGKEGNKTTCNMDALKSVLYKPQ